MTIPLGIKTLSGAMGTGSVAVVLAGVTMSLFVPTLLYLFGQKYIMRASVMSRLKAKELFNSKQIEKNTKIYTNRNKHFGHCSEALELEIFH